MARVAVVLSLLFLFVRCFIPGAEASPKRYEFKQLHMGTLFRIVLYGPDGVDVQKAARSAFARIEELEEIFSSYREDSELNQVAMLAYESPQVLSPDLYSVLDVSLRLSRLTEGAFDITVRPFVKIWQHAKVDGRLPDETVLNREGRRVGYKRVLLNPRTRSLRFRIPGIQLDLGGIGKGYAADEALAVLRRHQIVSALVYAGGDIRLGSPPPARNGWTIELSERRGGRELLLRNCAIASSGDAFQFVEIEGVRYSHIIDPRSGLGVQGQRSATVIAPEGTIADALATALTIIGPVRGFEIIRPLEGVSAQFIHYPNGEKKVFRSAGFPP